MSTSVNASRIVALLVTSMAAVLVLSGPVAGVLDLPEPTAEAKKKHKKKKKKKNKPPAFNVVNCADVGFTCNGTAGNDFLVGTPGSEQISGEEGNDVYQANGGNSILIDRSTTSSDFYTAVDPGAGQNTLIFDDGGPADFLDMGSFRALDDVTFIRFSGNDNLILNIDGGKPNTIRKVEINGHFGEGRIETIRFANGTVTGAQAQSLAREANPEEQAAIEESFNEEESSSSSGEAAQSEKASS